MNEGARWADTASHLRRMMDTVGAVGAMDIPDLPDLRQLTDGARLLHRSAPLHEVLRTIEGQSIHFSLPELPESPDRLLHGMALHDKSTAAQDRLNALKKWNGDLSGSSFAGIDGLSVEGLSGMATRIVDGYRMGKQSVGIRKALSMALIEMDCAQKEHELIEKEYQERLQEFGACPFCGSTTHRKETH
jgi:hypothetical protein